jgi:hypothetical protein
MAVQALAPAQGTWLLSVLRLCPLPLGSPLLLPIFLICPSASLADAFYWSDRSRGKRHGKRCASAHLPTLGSANHTENKMEVDSGHLPIALIMYRYFGLLRSPTLGEIDFSPGSIYHSICIASSLQAAAGLFGRRTASSYP